jgi:hypothetical protein
MSVRICACCRDWAAQLPVSAALITNKGSIIFSALALYDALKQLLDFHAEDGDAWTPQLATALVVFVFTACAAPFLFRFSRGTGSLVLVLLGEMGGWSWIGAFEHTSVGHGSNEEKLVAVLKVLGVLLVVTPLYLVAGRLLRAKAHASSRLQRKMSELDQDVAAYVLGYVLQVFFGTAMNHMLLQGETLSIDIFFFLIELYVASRIVFIFESLRAHAPFTHEASAEATRVTVEGLSPCGRPWFMAALEKITKPTMQRGSKWNLNLALKRAVTSLRIKRGSVCCG